MSKSHNALKEGRVEKASRSEAWSYRKKDSQLVRNMELWGILIDTFAILNENLKSEI